MEKHLELHLQGHLKCFYCQQEFAQKAQVLRHEIAEHASLRITCEYCAEKLSSSQALNKFTRYQLGNAMNAKKSLLKRRQ